MAKNDEDISKMMERLGCVGEHITKSGITDKIEEVQFQTIMLAGSKFMFCGIRMKGGFVVTGKPSACIDPKNWRDEIGEKVSFDNTFDNIWQLEAYLKMNSQ